MDLRLYQDNIILALARKIKQGIRKIVGQLATGGGKTVIFSAISSRYIAKSTKDVLILVHRKELAAQTRKTLHTAYNIDAQYIKSGMRYIPPARVYVGMVESVHRRIDKIKNIGMLIIDEAHIASFNKIHEHFPECIIIGFSATPMSANKKKPMKDYYEDIVCGVDIPELIKDGFLCQNITRSPKDIVDRANLATKGDDFDEVMMSQEFSKSQYVNSTISSYEKFCKGFKTLVFNVNIAHNNVVCEAFTKAGYNVRVIDSKMDDSVRDSNLKWFKETEDAILCNVGIATVGFDEPTIMRVIVNKSTKSVPMWLQVCGRGGRIIDEQFISEKQSQYPYTLKLKSLFEIIDMGGNGLTHGDWNVSRDWNRLFHDPKKPSDGVAPVKECPQCVALIPASAQICPWCEFEFLKKEPLPEEEIKEFEVITKNISVNELIESHKQKQEYYVFFQIGRDLALHAQNTFTKMSDESFNFILQKYYELGRKWTKEVNTQREADRSKISFNKWHQEKAKENLLTELKNNYTGEWEKSPTALASTPE